MIEKHYRSIVKAISWRLVATLLTTFVIVYTLTGELALSIGVGVLELIIKITFYYFHERIWNKIKFGQIANGE